MTSVGFPFFKIGVTQLRFQIEERESSVSDLLKIEQIGNVRKWRHDAAISSGSGPQVDSKDSRAACILSTLTEMVEVRNKN